MRKYEIRRRLCPTVQQWQSRIVPRLKENHWPGFRQVRARVAASFAHAQVLGGNPAAALEIVHQFGAEMPRNWSSRLMTLGARGGRLGWRVGCQAIRLREAAKSRMIQLRNRRAGRSAARPGA
jgi:hypothetical protein